MPGLRKPIASAGRLPHRPVSDFILGRESKVKKLKAEIDFLKDLNNEYKAEIDILKAELETVYAAFNRLKSRILLAAGKDYKVNIGLTSSSTLDILNHAQEEFEKTLWEILGFDVKS